jgi:signal transduction histidine kinase
MRAVRVLIVEDERKLANVIDNAIKYSPVGASIVVSIRDDVAHAMIEVADQGSGIAPEDRERIFDRFFRVDSARSRDAGGTGLGLAIAKWAVEINGGSIRAEAGASCGSVFVISLPRGHA